MFKMIKKNKVLAIALSAVLLVSVIAIGMAGAFAKTDKETITFENPNPLATAHLQLVVGGTPYDLGIANTAEWRSNKQTVATVVAKNANTGTITAVAAGKATIVSATKFGAANSMDVQVQDKSKIASYVYEEGRSANIKNNGDTLDITGKINALNANSANVDSSIKWESWGTEYATVTEAGVITAVSEGTAIIVGKAMDCWGVDQLIPFTVVVGNPYKEKLGDGVIQVGEDFYKPVLDEDGDPTGVWEKTDSTGEEDTGEFVGGNEEIPNPLDPLYKIQPEDNDKQPPADEYDNTYEGYLTTKPDGTSEYDKWTEAVENGVVKKGDDYYKPVRDEDGNPTGVWEKTNETGEESTDIFVGGTTEEPNPSIPLYKIQPEDNEGDHPASDFDLTYPGYLTTLPPLTCEYDQWQTARGEEVSEIPNIDINTHRFIMGKNKAGYPIEWQVLAVDRDNNRMLVIPTTVIAEKRFHNVDIYPGWGKTDMRNFLVSYFEANFTEDEKAKVYSTNVKTRRNELNSTIETSVDRLFLLSDDEVRTYWPSDSQRNGPFTFHGAPASSSPLTTYLTSFGENRYWLRNTKLACTARYVGNHGIISDAVLTYGYDDSNPIASHYRGGVRPVMWITMNGDAAPIEPINY